VGAAAGARVGGGGGGRVKCTLGEEEQQCSSAAVKAGGRGEEENRSLEFARKELAHLIDVTRHGGGGLLVLGRGGEGGSEIKWF